MHWLVPISKKLWDCSEWKHLLTLQRRQRVIIPHSWPWAKEPCLSQGEKRLRIQILPWRDPTVTYTAAEQNSTQAAQGQGSLETPASPSPSQPAHLSDTLWMDVSLPRCTEEATGSWALEPGSLLLRCMVNTYWKWDRTSRTTRTANGNAAPTARQNGKILPAKCSLCSWGMADRNEHYKQSFQNLPRVEKSLVPFFAMLIRQYTTIHSIVCCYSRGFFLTLSPPKIVSVPELFLILIQTPEF